MEKKPRWNSNFAVCLRRFSSGFNIEEGVWHPVFQTKWSGALVSVPLKGPHTLPSRKFREPLASSWFGGINGVFDSMRAIREPLAVKQTKSVFRVTQRDLQLTLERVRV
ncbi:hypothetical protein AVEN_38575-1 [Araneus ventricosus]|uniref:Uncharacterized protein n=1 Tax=Araneus ventricosus TaxID=182803 RepID=A0A4Y2LBW0_ARAVE|nr:hypothetical protein AVEN_38575-1 [Araneus ventricosus]